MVKAKSSLRSKSGIQSKGRKKQSLFSPPKNQHLARIVSIETSKQAKSSSITLLQKYKEAETRAEQTRILRATVLVMNRTNAALKRQDLSENTRKELTQVAEIYSQAKEKMKALPRLSKVKPQITKSNETIDVTVRDLSKKEDGRTGTHIHVIDEDGSITTEVMAISPQKLDSVNVVDAGPASVMIEGEAGKKRFMISSHASGVEIKPIRKRKGD